MQIPTVLIAAAALIGLAGARRSIEFDQEFQV